MILNRSKLYYIAKTVFKKKKIYKKTFLNLYFILSLTEISVSNECLIKIHIYHKNLHDTFHMLNSGISVKVLIGIHSVISASILYFEFIIK